MHPQILGGDTDAVAQKKKTIPFSEIKSLVFSFRCIAKIDSLQGLNSLTKLQLDNNQITQINNIAHLVSIGICISLGFVSPHLPGRTNVCTHATASLKSWFNSNGDKVSTNAAPHHVDVSLLATSTLHIA